VQTETLLHKWYLWYWGIGEICDD